MPLGVHMHAHTSMHAHAHSWTKVIYRYSLAYGQYILGLTKDSSKMITGAELTQSLDWTI